MFSNPGRSILTRDKIPKTLVCLWATCQICILTAQTVATKQLQIACEELPPDSCISLISQQRPHAEKWQWAYDAATYFLDKNQFEKSLEAYTRCLKSGIEASDSLLALVYNDMGICADEIGLYNLANQHYLEGIALAKKSSDSLLLLSQLYSNLGILHTKTWNTQTASFYQKMPWK